MFNEEKGQPAQIMFSGISVTSGETTQCEHDDLNFKKFQTNCTDPSRHALIKKGTSPRYLTIWSAVVSVTQSSRSVMIILKANLQTL